MLSAEICVPKKEKNGDKFRGNFRNHQDGADAELRYQSSNNVHQSFGLQSSEPEDFEK